MFPVTPDTEFFHGIEVFERLFQGRGLTLVRTAAAAAAGHLGEINHLTVSFREHQLYREESFISRVLQTELGITNLDPRSRQVVGRTRLCWYKVFRNEIRLVVWTRR